MGGIQQNPLASANNSSTVVWEKAIEIKEDVITCYNVIGKLTIFQER